MNVGERNAVITGVGQSNVGRRIYEDPLAMTIDATLEAVEHAGLSLADIDGISTYPGNMNVPPGSPGSVWSSCRTHYAWSSTGSPVASSCPASSERWPTPLPLCRPGLVENVVCFRTVWEASAQGDKGRASVTMGGGGGSYRAQGFLQWTLPFGAASAANWIGMMANLHFHRYGTTRRAAGLDRAQCKAKRRHQPQGDLLAIRCPSRTTCTCG